MRLNYRVYGAGEPVIILHGLFGSLDNWHTFSELLAARFRVIALDQRNHGGSPRSPEMSYRLMAEDLREFMEAQGIASANVLGHSMGGKTAMQFALDHAQRVRRLVVADISPGASEFRHRGILDALLAFDPARYGSRREMDQALASDLPDTRLRQFLLKSVGREADGTFAWKLGLKEIDRNYRSLCEAVSGSAPFDGPSLFIRGEFSNYLVPSDRPMIEKLFARAEFETVSGAGHWLQVENLAGFLSPVSNFLSR